MIHVTETHSLVWFLTASKRLSAAAYAAINDASIPLIIPTIVLAEIGFLQVRGRIEVTLPMVLAHADSRANIATYPFDALVAQRLPTSLEMHDAIIVATALVHEDLTGQPVALITRDEQIAASGLLSIVW